MVAVAVRMAVDVAVDAGRDRAANAAKAAAAVAVDPGRRHPKIKRAVPRVSASHKASLLIRTFLLSTETTEIAIPLTELHMSQRSPANPSRLCVTDRLGIRP